MFRVGSKNLCLYYCNTSLQLFQFIRNKYDFLHELGIENENPGYFDGKWGGTGKVLESISPASGCMIAKIQMPSLKEVESTIEKTHNAWFLWSTLPPPKRGEIIRQIGNMLRNNKISLGKLISLEMGKILSEGIGEVQEYIDICDYAVGLSRMLPGKIFPSERDNHILLELWNPIGAVGIITAFNFPAAVFGWNSALAMVCGNTTVWKSSPTTPLTSIAITKIISRVLEANKLPGSIASLVTGSGDIGHILTSDKRLPLISFTGSSTIGKRVAHVVQERFGKTILELGGNNAMIVLDDADIEMAVKSAVFSCIGTAGQRCTSTRRIILHRKIEKQFTEKLKKAYTAILEKTGDPLDNLTLYSPLHSEESLISFEAAVESSLENGGKLEFGGKRIQRPGYYVEPTIISGLEPNLPIVKKETFAPIVYKFEIDSLEEGITLNNCVDQGLSSSLFTRDIQNFFKWIGPTGSDCGIINLNIGTSGAEIGGAFGGDKSSGGGRESGSDAWKNYMRRSTITVNFGKNVPLAQGIIFT
ncbi:putative aldehyde dehydrogenase family 7 member A1 homolog [Phymastichus coffea]|uniref:putative aldehyde dehydrogenase family 7 member A1 homolog n=1 Tax=Phymastichus coffea TaxID=108790 RepID=UPI00273B304F|nr:putative aldehyde dehydrogenase family 7 member A1 homolog [Phymastichus coffea]